MASAKGEALARRAEERLQEMQVSLRHDLQETDDAQFRALAETAAEVLGGLRHAFEDYREGEEAAWKSGA